MSFKTRSTNTRSSSNIFASSNTYPKDKPVPKVCQHYDNPGDRLAHNVVGSTEWTINNHLVQGNPGNPEIMVYNASNETRLIITDNGKYTRDAIIAQTELVNNILSFINENGWAQFDGGNNHLKWVTPKYPDKVFETGRIKEESSGEIHYFPVSDTDNDPLGIATHYRVSSSGNSCTIEHNGFTAYGNSKARSFWRYRTKRNKRLKEQNMHNAELLNESIKAEKLLKLGPERAEAAEKGTLYNTHDDESGNYL